MANCILAYPNHIDSEFNKVQFSAGNWIEQLPLENLKDPVLTKTSRTKSTQIEDSILEIDLAIIQDIKVIVIPKHNLSRDSKIRIEIASDENFNQIIYDTKDINVYGDFYPLDTLNWQDPRWWDGRETEENLSGYNVAFIHILPSAILAQYVRISIKDASNKQGYIELSRLFIAPGWQPQINLAYGVEFGLTSESFKQKSLGGALYVTDHIARRYVNFELENITPDDAFSSVFEMQRQLDIKRQLFFIFDPEDTTHLHRRSFLGVLKNLTPIEYPHYQTNNAHLYIEEVIA